MLKYRVKRSVGEDFQEVATPPKENVWIHGDQITESELASIAERYDMDLNTLHDTLDKDELPRVEIKEGKLYVFVRSVQRSKRGTVTTTPVLLAVNDSIFINLSTATTVDHGPMTPSVHVRMHNATSMLLWTFAAVVSEYEDLMQRTARHVKDTGHRLKTHEVTNDDFIQFVTVEDDLNEYKMNLNGMLVVAERLREILHTGADTEAVEDILLYIRQLLVAIDSHNQSILSIRNAYGTIANNVLNQRMKTLTVFTVMIALPNVFFGMYGMNVPLPFQTESWVYPSILIFSLLVIFITFVYSKRKHIF